MNPFIAIPLMLFLLLLKGLFSGSEIALVNADKIRLKRMAKNGHHGARLVLKAFEKPDELLSTTLIGTNMTTIALTTIGTLLMVQLLGKEGDLWAFLLFTPLFLILGEIVPKSIFQEKSDYLTPILIYPLVVMSTLLWPIIFVFSRIARLAARIAGGKDDQGLFVSKEQLSEIVKLAEDSGSLGKLNEGQLRRVLNFSETSVSQIMIPLKEVKLFEKHTPASDVIQYALKSGHRRFPIYESNRQDIIGIAIISNWEMLQPDILDQSINSFIKPAIYVTAMQTLDEILPVVLDRADRMAVVVDDLGEAIGIASFEDLISSVIGDINIGSDAKFNLHREYNVVRLDDNSLIIDGDMPVFKLNELIGKNHFSTQYRTVNSIILNTTRAIPKTNDVINICGYDFFIKSASDRAVLQVRLQKE